MNRKLLLLALFFSSLASYGQQTLIRGKVTDGVGSPLPGTNVVVSGTTTGTTTDSNGNFELSVPPDSKLIVSFIGFQKQEFEVGTRTQFDVVLIEDGQTLDEIVVTGFGTQERRDLTGAVSSVKAEQLTQIPAANFQSGLQGLAPGLSITGASGSAGAPVRVRVRGTGSLYSGGDPLYIIDGVPVENDFGANFNATSRGTQQASPLSSIDPNEIASIEVLKDAAAASIYGSRAANGVILITTKRGKAGVTKFTANFQYGITQPTNRVDYLDGTQYMDLRAESITRNLNSGIVFNNLPGNVPLTYVNGGYDQWFLNVVPAVPFNSDIAAGVARENIDHFDDIFQTGYNRQANVSASGGSDKTQFYLSASVYDESSYLSNNFFKRLNGRANVDHIVNDKFKLGVQISGSYNNNSVFPAGGASTFNAGSGGYVPGGFSAAAGPLLPIFPRYNDDGTYFAPDRGLSNLALMDNQLFFDKTEMNRYFTNFYADYTIAPSLSLRTELGSDFLAQVIRFYVNPALTSGAAAGTLRGLNDYRTRNVNNINNNTYITYDKEIGQDHSINAVAGVQYTYNVARTSYVQAQNIPVIPALNTTQTALQAVAQNRLDEYAFLSFLGRVNYKFLDRYLLGATVRRDGSSRFGEDNRWGTFPSISAGWIISEEAFLNSRPWLSFLKFRGSWGQTGNSQQGSIVAVNFPALGLGTNNGAYGDALGFPLRRVPELARRIKWERSTLTDIAVDFGFLDNRLNGTLAYYYRKTTDMILGVDNAPQAGIIGGANFINGGRLDNWGIEMNLTVKVVDKSKFKWQVDLNAAENRNELKDLAGLPPSAVASVANQSFVGMPVGTYFLPEYLGVDPETGYELYSSVVPDSETGFPMHDSSNPVIVDYLGRIAGTTNNVNWTALSAPVKEKYAQPRWTGGITNTFSYGLFTLSSLVTFSTGSYVLDLGARDQSRMLQVNRNIRSEFLEDAWEKPGDKATNPAFYFNPTHNNQNTTRFLYNADFVRLKNVRLSINLPGSVLSRLKLTSTSIFVNATNVLTFTDFPGWDPEVVGSDSFNQFSNQASNLSPATVNNEPPQARTILVGVNLGF